MHRKASEQSLEKLQRIFKARRSNENNRDAIGTKSCDERSRADWILVSSNYLLHGSGGVTSNFLLDLPARRAKIETRTAMPRDSVLERIRRRSNGHNPQIKAGSGSVGIQTRQTPSPKREVVSGQLRLWQSVAAKKKNSSLDRLSQLQASPRKVKVCAETNVDRRKFGRRRDDAEG